MRIVLFSFVNVFAALLFGWLAYQQGHGAGRIVLTVVIVIVALQLAYAVWLVAASFLSSVQSDAATKSRDSDAEPGAGRKAVAGTPEGNGGPGS